MNSGLFLLSFLIATIVWQVIAQVAGPPVGKWIYSLRVENFKQSGFSFRSDEDAEAWMKKTITSSMNQGLLILAIACGALIGTFGLPLIGFSRSVNPWSWARIIALCGTSWIFVGIFHPTLLS